MALGPYALITWEYAQAMLDLEDADQEKIENLIDMATAYAEKTTWRRLKARDLAEVYDGTGRKSLILPDYPVNTITSLWIDTNREFGSDTLVTDYYAELAAGIVYYDYYFPIERQSVKLAYNAGFSTIPDDLQMTILEIVEHSFLRIIGKGLGVRAVQNPTGIVTQYELVVPMSAHARLETYRRAA